jgi:hypothetical protein
MAGVAVSSLEYLRLLREGEPCDRCEGRAIVVQRPDWAGHGRLICRTCGHDQGVRLEFSVEPGPAPTPEQWAGVPNPSDVNVPGIAPPGFVAVCRTCGHESRALAPYREVGREGHAP